jgi:protein translocase SecG subunit
MSHLAKNIILFQITVGVILIIAIISQNRGAGLSNVFGGGGAIYRTKRGFEKWLFYATIVLAIAFAALSIAAIVANKA